MLIRFLEWWSGFSRCEVISGHGCVTPYLVRYHLINLPFCKLYLHYFLRSDADDPHDHPWDFTTYMLRGTYTEEVYDIHERHFTRWKRYPGDVLKRKAEDIHRIRVRRSVRINSYSEWKRMAPVTLFFATRKRKEWGFIRNYKTKPRWVHWKEYLDSKA